MFDRKVPFFMVMQRIEARKWNYPRESFDQYATDKLALMYNLNLPKPDEINMLIGGIMKSSLKGLSGL